MPHLLEDEGHGLPHDVREHVEPAPVWHPDDEAVSPHLRRAVDGVLQGGDDCLAAIKAEALGGIELGGEVVLEGVGEAEALEYVQLW